MQYQICKGNQKNEILQLTEQHVVPKKFDLVSNASKTCETKFHTCTICLITKMYSEPCQIYKVGLFGTKLTAESLQLFS